MKQEQLLQPVTGKSKQQKHRFFEPACRQVKQHGFTLIELLVVIAIIAILAAMLFPGLNSAREQGRSIFCTGNLKTIAQASVIYHADYKFYMDLYTHGNSFSSGPVWETTIFLAAKIISAPNDRLPTRISSSGRGNLACPTLSMPLYSEMAVGNVTEGYSYQYNNTFASNYGKSIDKMKMPSIAIMFGEGDVGYPALYSRISDNPALLKNRHFRNRHGKHANISFADGHQGKVDTWKLHYTDSVNAKKQLHPYGYQ